MSAGYNTKCRSCGQDSFVIWDYLSLRHKGKDIPLPHPGESHHLEEKFSLTENEAALAGRLHRNDCWVCGSCKEVFYKQSLSLPDDPPPSKNSTRVLVVLWVLVLAFLFFKGIHTLWIMVVGIVSGVIFTLVVPSIEGRRIRKRLIAQYSISDITTCPKCESGQISRLPELALNDGDEIANPCPHCESRDSVITGSFMS